MFLFPHFVRSPRAHCIKKGISYLCFAYSATVSFLQMSFVWSWIELEMGSSGGYGICSLHRRLLRAMSRLLEPAACQCRRVFIWRNEEDLLLCRLPCRRDRSSDRRSAEEDSIAADPQPTHTAHLEDERELVDFEWVQTRNYAANLMFSCCLSCIRPTGWCGSCCRICAE